ncbi:hypothetical protein D3C78_1059210 [compost metagenome]
MAALPGHVPQGDRIGLRPVAEPGHAGDALGDLAFRFADRAESAQVTLDVGGEHRHAGIAERLGEALQGDGLAGAGGAGDQAVAVGQAQQAGDRLARRIGAKQELTGFGHGAFPWQGDGEDSTAPL